MMHRMQAQAGIGLRERKKAETRLAIERAAVEIACDRGYGAATAEAIAARANVSLRTFFNYFPSKDVAIVGQGLALIDDLQAGRILEQSGADLLKGIARVAEACAAEADPTSELMRRRRRLILENPPLLHARVVLDARFDNWLATIVTEYFRVHPSRRRLMGRATGEEEARLAVAAVSSAVHYLVQQAIERDIDTDIAAEDIEETIDLMAEIHRKGS